MTETEDTEIGVVLSAGKVKLRRLQMNELPRLHVSFTVDPRPIVAADVDHSELFQPPWPVSFTGTLLSSVSLATNSEMAVPLSTATKFRYWCT